MDIVPKPQDPTLNNSIRGCCERGPRDEQFHAPPLHTFHETDTRRCRVKPKEVPHTMRRQRRTVCFGDSQFDEICAICRSLEGLSRHRYFDFFYRSTRRKRPTCCLLYLQVGVLIILGPQNKKWNVFRQFCAEELRHPGPVLAERCCSHRTYISRAIMHSVLKMETM